MARKRMSAELRKRIADAQRKAVGPVVGVEPITIKLGFDPTPMPPTDGFARRGPVVDVPPAELEPPNRGEAPESPFAAATRPAKPATPPARVAPRRWDHPAAWRSQRSRGRSTIAEGVLDAEF